MGFTIKEKICPVISTEDIQSGCIREKCLAFESKDASYDIQYATEVKDIKDERFATVVANTDFTKKTCIFLDTEIEVVRAFKILNKIQRRKIYKDWAHGNFGTRTVLLTQEQYQKMKETKKEPDKQLLADGTVIAIK